MSSFHFYRWNQFKVIFLASTVRTGNLPYIRRHVQSDFTACYSRYITNDDGGRGLMTSLAEGTDIH